MKNKTLQRILKKSLSVQSDEELTKLFDQWQAPSDFREHFFNCMEMVDNAITDLDRVIDIRDRSLSISSNEMMALNEKIQTESAKQKDMLMFFEEGHRISSAMSFKALEVQFQESV